jgi:hypothetical protein
MEPTAAPETSSGNSPRTLCKTPKTKNQYSLLCESLKSRQLSLLCKTKHSGESESSYTQFVQHSGESESSYIFVAVQLNSSVFWNIIKRRLI